MATIKSYTDLPQSKKLMKFLPLESADIHYERAYFEGKQSDWFVKLGSPVKSDDIIPCWSLSALLDIIPYAINISDNKFYRLGIDKGYNSYAIWYEDNGCTVNTLDVKANNFIDACYEMIIRLRKLNLL